MTERTLGKPIAQGRTADVYAWGDGHVLKLFHEWFSPEDIEYEARLARAVHACGLPVPAPGEIRRVGGRAGLVYGRVDGTPMLAVLQREPWRAIDFARRLARLHARMHDSELQADVPAQRRILESKLRHGDMHPGNVLLTPSGEVIIDWIDASRGNPLADVARTSVIAQGAASSAQIPQAPMKAFVRIFDAVYRRHYFGLRPGGEDEFRHWLPIVAAARLSENIPELETWLTARARDCRPV